MATLLGLGLFMVYSASFTTQGTTFFTRQIIWIALGVVSCAIMAFIPHDWWRRLAVPIMVGTVLLLAAVLVLGTNDFGASRRLLGGSFQPSEFAKLALVIYVAAWVAVRGDKIFRISGRPDSVPDHSVRCRRPDCGRTQHQCNDHHPVHRHDDLLRRGRQLRSDSGYC